MKNKGRVIIVLLSLIAVILLPLQPVSSRLFETTSFERGIPAVLPPWRDLLLNLLLAKTVLSSVNLVLLTILLLTYLDVYRKTRSEFSLGLVIFSLALLFYSLTSNPVVHRLAGFKLTGLGPFTMLPDLFTCIASAILLYLSRQ